MPKKPNTISLADYFVPIKLNHIVLSDCEPVILLDKENKRDKRKTLGKDIGIEENLCDYMSVSKNHITVNFMELKDLSKLFLVEEERDEDKERIISKMEGKILKINELMPLLFEHDLLPKVIFKRRFIFIVEGTVTNKMVFKDLKKRIKLLLTKNNIYEFRMIYAGQYQKRYRKLLRLD